MRRALFLFFLAISGAGAWGQPPHPLPSQTRPELHGPGLYCAPDGWSVRLNAGDRAQLLDAPIPGDPIATVTQFHLGGRHIRVFQGMLETDPQPIGRKVRSYHLIGGDRSEYMAFWEVRDAGAIEYRLIMTDDPDDGDFFIVRSPDFHGYEADLWFFERADPTSSARDEACMTGTRRQDYASPAG